MSMPSAGQAMLQALAALARLAAANATEVATAAHAVEAAAKKQRAPAEADVNAVMTWAAHHNQDEAVQIATGQMFEADRQARKLGVLPEPEEAPKGHLRHHRGSGVPVPSVSPSSTAP